LTGVISIQYYSVTIFQMMSVRDREYIMKLVRLLRLAPLLGATIAIVSNASPALALSAPFTWQSTSWCPNIRGTYGSLSSCSATQAGFAAGDASFNPTQVSIDAGNHVILTMNSTGTSSGAFNTGGQETYSASAKGNIIQERIGGSGKGGALPCSGSPAKIDNWPAFWLVTTGSWPANGEIDVMEGLHGVPAWHYHYLSAAGVKSAVGSTYPNVTNCSAPVTYKAVWFSGTNPRIDFYTNGVHEGTVAQHCTGLPSPCAPIDVPVATGPMYLMNNYENDNGTESGSLVNNVSMKVLSLIAKHN
jgi:hypothetical protein